MGGLGLGLGGTVTNLNESTFRRDMHFLQQCPAPIMGGGKLRISDAPPAILLR